MSIFHIHTILIIYIISLTILTVMYAAYISILFLQNNKIYPEINDNKGFFIKRKKKTRVITDIIIASKFYFFLL
jgi:hypothetical protein